MPIARTVAVGLPHHVIQKGARGINLFHCDEDRSRYLNLLRTNGARYGCDFWAWCLMSNHIHLVAVPRNGDSLARTMGESHRLYARRLNKRQDLQGHLFQERFRSYPIDNDAYLLGAICYIELNPVEAGLVKQAVDYEWSSARHHIFGSHDTLIASSPVRDMVRDWAGFLSDTTAQRVSRVDIERRLAAFEKAAKNLNLSRDK